VLGVSGLFCQRVRARSHFLTLAWSNMLKFVVFAPLHPSQSVSPGRAQDELLVSCTTLSPRSSTFASAQHASTHRGCSGSSAGCRSTPRAAAARVRHHSQQVGCHHHRADFAAVARKMGSSAVHAILSWSFWTANLVTAAARMHVVPARCLRSGAAPRGSGPPPPHAVLCMCALLAPRSWWMLSTSSWRGRRPQTSPT
jgi:hypothetical protein